MNYELSAKTICQDHKSKSKSRTQTPDSIMSKLAPRVSISSEDSMIADQNHGIDTSSSSSSSNTKIEHQSSGKSRKWYWPFGKNNNDKQKVPKRKLFRFASRGDKWLIALAYFCSIVCGLLQPCSVLFFAISIQQVNESLDDKDKSLSDAMMPMVKVFIYLGTLNLVFAYFHNFLWVLTGERQTRRIRQHYVHAILRQDMAWFDQSAQESLTARLAAETQAIQDGISEHYGNYVRIISSSVFGIMMSFGMCYQVSCVVVGTLPALGGVLLVSGYLVNKNASQAQAASAAAGAIAEQVFAGIRTVYAFSLQTRFSRMHDFKLATACHYGVRRAIFVGIGTGGFLFVLCSIFGVAFYYGGQLVADGTVAAFRVVGGFFIIILGSITLLGLPAHYKHISSACTVAYKVFQTIDRVPSIDPDSKDGIVPGKVIGRVEFRNVMFKYPTRPDVTILKNLCLDIEPGTTVAFVGASGSGKSTSIQLLQRFYDPLQGQVFLDGTDIRQLNLRWLREQIGVVSQEPVLFNMSIRQNLMMGLNRSASQEEIVAACQKANCHAFISKLPQGYDTLVGSGMLSGGQKQRIAIARAILKNPPILLLDEATSALDTQSERLVQRALDAASVNRTTIVIAHRLSTIRNADKIVVMHRGDLIEQGTHSELLAQNGIYAELVRKQEISTTEEDQGNCHSFVQYEDKVQFDGHQDMSVSMPEDEDKEPNPYVDGSLQRSGTHSSVMSVDAYEMKRLREKAELKKKRHQRTPIRKIVSQLRPEWHLLFLGGCGSLIAGAVKPCIGYIVIRTIFTLVMDNGDDATASVVGVTGANLWALVFVIIGIGAFIGNSLMTGAFEVAGERYTEHFRAAVFRAFLRQEIGYFDLEENSLGALTSRLNVDAVNVHEVVTRVWADVLQMISTVITGMVISIVYSWKMTLVVLVWSPLIFGATFYEARLQSGFQDKTAKANEHSGQIASEAIKEIRTVAALGKQEYFENRYSKATERPHRLAIRKAYLSSISFGIMQGVVLYAAGVSFYAGIKFIEDGSMEVTPLFVCLMAVLITMQGAGQASTFVSTYMKAKVSAITMFEVLERRTAIDPDLEGYEAKSSQISGDVSFENITFRYPARPDLPIFNGQFNLHGYSGQTIALVGPSGCGKSTCIGMLQRWYDPLSGTVRLDDHNVKGFYLHNLRSHMALVGQEPVLFNLTIGENIRFGIGEDANVTQAQVEEAAKAANIHSFITNLPDGYNTNVGDKGSQLSGGQKQRIAIARALIRKPKILLLDEATSALDSESEKMVQQALDNIISQGGRTTITIAHRLSTIQNADVIFVIKNGRVVERGSHFELLRLNGVYADLVREQSLGAA